MEVVVPHRSPAVVWPPVGTVPPFALARGSLVLSQRSVPALLVLKTSGLARPGMLRPRAFVSRCFPGVSGGS